jgi:beta-glucanase (GH16 family)
MNIELRWKFATIVLILTLSLAEGGWVDPDTPEDRLTTQALATGDHRTFQLVFSDEFEQEGRTFNDGNDPRWTAISKNDCK